MRVEVCLILCPARLSFASGAGLSPFNFLGSQVIGEEILQASFKVSGMKFQDISDILCPEYNKRSSMIVMVYNPQSSTMVP